MPRHDRYHEEELMSRERGQRDFDERDRGAMFDRDRDFDRDEREPGREQGRGRSGGFESLLSDERGLTMRAPSQRPKHRFGPDDLRSDIPRDETERLIASNKVEGTPVFDRHGERIGSIHNFMVDKFRGQVVYAVLKHSSGFLGLEERFYPLDWDQLTFDTRLGGYHVGITEDQLKDLGSWDRNQRWQGRRGEMTRGRFDRDLDRDREFERSRDRDRW